MTKPTATDQSMDRKQPIAVTNLLMENWAKDNTSVSGCQQQLSASASHRSVPDKHKSAMTRKLYNLIKTQSVTKGQIKSMSLKDTSISRLSKHSISSQDSANKTATIFHLQGEQMLAQSVDSQESNPYSHYTRGLLLQKRPSDRQREAQIMGTALRKLNDSASKAKLNPSAGATMKNFQRTGSFHQQRTLVSTATAAVHSASQKAPQSHKGEKKQKLTKVRRSVNFIEEYSSMSPPHTAIKKLMQYQDGQGSQTKSQRKRLLGGSHSTSDLKPMLSSFHSNGDSSEIIHSTASLNCNTHIDSKMKNIHARTVKNQVVFQQTNGLKLPKRELQDHLKKTLSKSMFDSSFSAAAGAPQSSESSIINVAIAANCFDQDSLQPGQLSSPTAHENLATPSQQPQPQWTYQSMLNGKRKVYKVNQMGSVKKQIALFKQSQHAEDFREIGTLSQERRLSNGQQKEQITAPKHKVSITAQVSPIRSTQGLSCDGSTAYRMSVSKHVFSSPKLFENSSMKVQESTAVKSMTNLDLDSPMRESQGAKQRYSQVFTGKVDRHGLASSKDMSAQSSLKSRGFSKPKVSVSFELNSDAHPVSFPRSPQTTSNGISPQMLQQQTVLLKSKKTAALKASMKQVKSKELLQLLNSRGIIVGHKVHQAQTASKNKNADTAEREIYKRDSQSTADTTQEKQTMEREPILLKIKVKVPAHNEEPPLHPMKEIKLDFSQYNL